LSRDGSPVRRPAPIERPCHGMQTTLIDPPLACRRFDRQMVATGSICGAMVLSRNVGFGRTGGEGSAAIATLQF